MSILSPRSSSPPPCPPGSRASCRRTTASSRRRSRTRRWRRSSRASTARGPVRVSVEGTDGAGPRRSTSSTCRPRRPAPTPAWKVLFYAQQHGDEISGKDALLFLVRDIARDPSLLPPDVDLWIFPMMNPDGAEAGTRRNAAGADLNRDHIALEQPETQALHRVVRRVRPARGRGLPRIRPRPEVVAREGLAEVARHHDGRAEQPALRRRRRRRRAALGRRGRRRRGEGGPSVPALLGGRRRRPTASSATRLPTSTAALNAVGMYGGLSFIIEAAALRRRRSGRRPRQPRGRVPRPLPALPLRRAAAAPRTSPRSSAPGRGLSPRSSPRTISG